ncbi:MAG: IclR family transcriptional regulator [Gammaproteobacteria bacterium]|uniref:IclR family transcriptional regulator n=1 Tax=Pseudacidovorax sp. TaxID=1934311 RepID=UPI001B68C0F7|nr:IclR family transcriptional regulator [Pseudacidovorax sp.]MBP6897524.1 IclR family transcriptional regulator [Pseudacidovorax sp.]
MSDIKNSAASDKNRIQSFGKMMDILGCFTTVDRSLSLARIAQSADLPRATTHRMLTALREIGFIQQDGRSGQYSLGLRLFELGSLALANLDLMREAKPFMDRLSRLASESAHLGVFDGYNVVVVEREDPQERVPGRHLSGTESAPAYCTSVGKAVLAFQGPEVVDRIIAAGLRPFTAQTLTSGEALRAELSTIRERGYAIDNSEHQIWVRCVAAPIRNAGGQVFAAVSVTGPADRMTDERIHQLSSLVIQAADSISMHLGYMPPR